MFSSQEKQAKKHIAGAIPEINRHLGYFNKNGPDGPDWNGNLRDLKKHLNNIKKYANRLKGSLKKQYLDYVRRIADLVRPIAERHNYPWDI